MSAPTLPPNVHVSKHPCLIGKLSQLRSKNTNSKETKQLVHDISTIVGTEALASLPLIDAGTDESPLGFPYPHLTVNGAHLTIVPILRSGLGMLDAIQSLLPNSCSVHHLGLFREALSLQPIEYYNNLPHQSAGDEAVPKLAILVDPVIATGGTSVAAIQTLREAGVQKIIVIAILGATPGVTAAAQEWPEGVTIYLGGLDHELTEKGYIKPGLGDIGDRLFLTMGKH